MISSEIATDIGSNYVANKLMPQQEIDEISVIIEHGINYRSIYLQK